MFSALIVDDEPLMREYLSLNLNKIDSDWEAADTASDGIYALSKLKKRSFDAVITDIKMPGMDGLRLARYLSENHPSTYIIILTGYTEFDYARTAVRLNVFDYLVKPLREEELAAALSGITARILQDRSGTKEKIPAYQGQEDSQNTLIKNVKDYLHLHFREAMSLTMLSDHFGVTAQYLSALFHKETSEPYSKYLLRLRMETASSLLLQDQGTLKIASIAEDVGFSSPKHFTSVFHSYFGCNPTEYRAKQLHQ